MGFNSGFKGLNNHYLWATWMKVQLKKNSQELKPTTTVLTYLVVW